MFKTIALIITNKCKGLHQNLRRHLGDFGTRLFGASCAGQSGPGSHHERGSLRPPAPATSPPPGSWTACTRVVSAASRPAPSPSSTACGAVISTRHVMSWLRSWRRKRSRCWLPVGLEVILPVSDQSRVPLHHDAVQRPRRLDDAV